MQTQANTRAQSFFFIDRPRASVVINRSSAPSNLECQKKYQQTTRPAETNTYSRRKSSEEMCVLYIIIEFLFKIDQMF